MVVVVEGLVVVVVEGSVQVTDSESLALTSLPPELSILAVYVFVAAVLEVTDTVHTVPLPQDVICVAPSYMRI